MTKLKATAATALALFVLALGLRVLHTRTLLADGIGTVLVQDAAYYHAEALRILEPGAARTDVRFMNLGYPYALAAVYAVTGPEPAAVLWIQAVLGALTAVIIAAAAARLLQYRWAGMLAGALYAAYGPALFYEGLLLIPATANALVAAALLAVAAGRGKASPGWSTTAGIAIGLAALLRAGSLVYVPVLAIVVGLGAPSRRRGVLQAVACAGAALAVVCPVIVASAIEAGRWVPITANGGMNFWVGNHRSAEGIYHAADFVSDVGARGEEDGFLTEAKRRTGRPDLSLVEADRFWLREGLRDVRNHFGRWLRIEGRKLALFWNRHETRTNVGLEFHRSLSPVLRVLPGFGLLAVLGLAGLASLLAAKRFWPASVVAAFVLVPMGVSLLFFVSGEYRHPAAPALAVAAAAILDVKRRRAPVAAALAAAVLATPVLLHRFPPLERIDHPRLDYANHAKALAAGPAPRFDRALALLERGRTAIGNDPFLLDATLRVRVLAALAHDDRNQARAALEAAETMLAWLRSREAGAFPERFRNETVADLHRGVAALAMLPSVRADPDLTRAAARLVR